MGARPRARGLLGGSSRARMRACAACGTGRRGARVGGPVQLPGEVLRRSGWRSRERCAQADCFAETFLDRIANFTDRAAEQLGVPRGSLWSSQEMASNIVEQAAATGGDGEGEGEKGLSGGQVYRAGEKARWRGSSREAATKATLPLDAAS